MCLGYSIPRKNIYSLRHFRSTTQVRYSAEEMYDLVNDIEAYPQFLPWCTAADIVSRNENTLSARIVLAEGKIKQSFTTANTLKRGRSIEMHLIEGPFKHLTGSWRFDPLDAQRCEVSLEMDFEFANRIISVAFGPIFIRILNSLIRAFQQRAVDLYGER